MIQSNNPLQNNTPLKELQKASQTLNPIKTEASSAIKVKQRTPEEIQALQKAAQLKKDAGFVGSKAQVADIKAKIKAINVENIQKGPELSTLQSVGNFFKATGSGIGSGFKALGNMGKDYLSYDAVKGAEQRAQGKVMKQTGKGLLEQAKAVRDDAGKLTVLATDIKAEMAKEPQDRDKISNLLKTGDDLLIKHGFAKPGNSAAFQAMQHIDDFSRIGEALTDFRSAAQILPFSAKGLDESGANLIKTGKELRSQGKHGYVQSTITGISVSSPVTKVVNFTSQAVYAAKNSERFADTLMASKGTIGSTALTTVAVIGGGLQVVSEGVELYRNYGKYKKSLSREENARAVLATPEQRQEMAAKLLAEAAELDKPKWYSRKSTREASAAELRAKAAELKAIDKTPVSDEAKAVAQQIVKRADNKFRLAKMILKNVVGIAAGVIGIVVAVGLLATPVGWIAAGVALGATIGFAIYSKVKSGQRQGKIDNLEKAQTQLTLKREALTQQKPDLEKQISELKVKLQAQIRVHDQAMSGDRRNFGSEAKLESEKAIEDGKRKLAEWESQLGNMNELLKPGGEMDKLQTDLTLQLIANSPEKGAKAVWEGVKKGDPAMKYIAETVLGVPDCQHLPEKTAIAVLKKGMSIYPGEN